MGITWRRALIRLLDQHVKGSTIHENLAVLRAYYALPLEEQQRKQEQRLVGLLEHAALHVPYYRQALQHAGVFTGGLIDLSRYGQIPLLTRDRLRREFERLKSDDLSARSWYKSSSGGSTGEPVSFVKDREWRNTAHASKHLLNEWAGMELGGALVKLWGSERDLLRGSIGPRAQLGNLLRNLTFLNSFRMAATDMERYAELLRRKRPALLEAYAESAYELARFINRSGLGPVRVGAVMTSAGTLYPFMREEIEKAFGCRAFNRYGSREVGDMACETSAHQGLRVCTYTHLVEVLDDNGNPCREGEEGEIVVTSLVNRAMPFIRYCIGDRGVARQLTTQPVPSVLSLANVTGRVTDCFVRRDGTTVPAAFFIHFLGVVHNDGWLDRVQIVQEDYDRVRIRMVVFRQPPAGDLDGITAAIQRVMGPQCNVLFESVDTIPVGESGKRRYTLSLVNRPERHVGARGYAG